MLYNNKYNHITLDFSRAVRDIVSIQQVIQFNREFFSGVDWCRNAGKR